MVVEIKPEKVDEEEIVRKVFLKSIDLLGGLKKLAEFRNLTWLASLARASYAVVLREEFLMSEDAIAQRLGLTRQTVRNILRADPQRALSKVRDMDSLNPEERRELRVHTAGGIAKEAYRLIKEGES